jgi:hypothetical protein
MLFDAIAAIILAGMMLIPLVNIVVGIVVGAGLAGVSGALVGLALAAFIMATEKLIGDRRGWFVPSQVSAAVEEPRRRAARPTRQRKLVLRQTSQRLITRAPTYFRDRLPLRPPLVTSAARNDDGETRSLGTLH